MADKYLVKFTLGGPANSLSSRLFDAANFLSETDKKDPMKSP
jgi:hypothetical protein